MESVPWDKTAENLWDVKGEKGCSAVRDMKNSVFRLRRFDLSTVVDYAKQSGWNVMELPRAVVKRWIHDTKTRLGRKVVPADDDAVFLSRAALCFTGSQSAVVITRAEPLSGLSDRCSLDPYLHACEIIVAAFKKLENAGGTLPGKINPNTIYISSDGAQRVYYFVPNSANQDVNNRGTHKKKIRRFMDGLADVVDFLREKTKRNEWFKWDIPKQELNINNARKFLLLRLKKAGLECAAEELVQEMEPSGMVTLSIQKPSQVGVELWLHLHRFIVTYNAVIRAWQNPHQLGTKQNPQQLHTGQGGLHYRRNGLRFLTRLMDELRQGTTENFLQAWELAQLILLEEEACKFVNFSGQQRLGECKRPSLHCLLAWPRYRLLVGDIDDFHESVCCGYKPAQPSVLPKEEEQNAAADRCWAAVASDRAASLPVSKSATRKGVATDSC